MKTFIIFSLFMLLLYPVYSQDITSPKYLPLKIGNVWVYDHYRLQFNFHERLKYKVIGDTIANGHKYYRTSAPLPFMQTYHYNLNLNLIRVDSIDGSILCFKYSSGCNYRPNDIVIDSLSAKINNTYYHCPFFMIRKCIDTGAFSMFGQIFKNKWFNYESGPSQTPSRYLYNIGLLGSAEGSYGQEGFNLMGCVIDGVLYGDTSLLLGIKPISNEIPLNFILYQNYPNPFNPTTKIKFELPKSSFTKLVIYDILGSEVTTLVNEQLNSGVFEVEWDASGYSNGVYFYKLYVDNYTETRKLVLMK